MTALSAGLASALADDTPIVFGAVRIALPGYTLRLLDGSGTVTFGGETYVGEDSTFGVLAGVGGLADGIGDQAPAIDITIIPPNDTAAGTLAAATMQGASVQLWVGSIARDTGLVRGDPYLAFAGEIDVPVIRSGPDGRSVDYQVVSVMERLFQEDEGFKLSDAFHQSVWSGETAFFDVTGIEQTIYWGQAPVTPTVSTGAFSGGGGGRESSGRIFEQ
jgi:hypothetical protein